MRGRVIARCARVFRRRWTRRWSIGAAAALLLAMVSAGVPVVRHVTRAHTPALHARLASTPLAPTSSTSMVAISSTPDGNGYWSTRADGGVYAYGDAPFYGSMSGQALSSWVRGFASWPDAHGYWMVGGDGAVYAYPQSGGRYCGGANTISHTGTIVGIASYPNGQGYWLVGNDGAVYSYPCGTQANLFYGSMYGQTLNAPIVGITPWVTGSGYWLVGADGGVFSLCNGCANPEFYGSIAGTALAQPVTNLVPTPSGQGYWLVAADGGVFPKGDAVLYRSLGGGGLTDIVGLAPTRSGRGYWFLGQDNAVFYAGDAGVMQ